ncbi:helix-turn-helix transcriptional regulator [Pedobacter petrophilus]|uniref:Helix-turn-helix transcriptional regulator n=1 Tax=Pedobacter petrophilus TaxID=1908241 RepID=A0A7K0FUD7_9SPHI|nr:LuxR C-terminal-related transcriptional regulator [Pedobacter petrophilus]MRX75011.1 helix-turn-helix transcriptional regulator [Pedobacter petrophilus]
MRDLLNIKLFSQSFETTLNTDQQLHNARLIAEMYSKLENGISVLSDLKARKSYLYYGAFAENLGLSKQENEINSIWEDQLLQKIHTEDLHKKYRLEFQFFQLLNTIITEERMDYEVITKLRIRNNAGKYVLVKHRLLYIASSEDGSIWLALCLYNMIYSHPEFSIPQGAITNKRTGKIIEQDDERFMDLLSTREKEILRLIKHGKRSKEIADQLALSINTVNRHRQNIFQKLNVSNALEACRIAETMGLLASVNDRLNQFG